MRFVSSIAITVALASAASADVSFSLGFDTEDMTIRTIEYECDEGQPFVVHYFTSESDVLALVPVDEVHIAQRLAEIAAQLRRKCSCLRC